MSVDFPRRVLSEERKYLALGDGEIDVLIGVKVAEPFADVLHAQQFTQSWLPPFFLLIFRVYHVPGWMKRNFVSVFLFLRFAENMSRY